MAENYQGGGFEVTIRCTRPGERFEDGIVRLKKKRVREFGRLVFSSVPFNDNPGGDVVRESWAANGGWIGILGIERGRHKDGSFRAPNIPKMDIYEDPALGIQVRLQCYECGLNPVFNLDALSQIMAEHVRAGNRIFDISLLPK